VKHTLMHAHTSQKLLAKACLIEHARRPYQTIRCK